MDIGPSEPDVSGKMTGKTSERVVELFREDPGLSIPEVAERLGKSARSVERAICTLRSSGKVARVGPAKGGSWRVVEREKGHARQYDFSGGRGGAVVRDSRGKT